MDLFEKSYTSSDVEIISYNFSEKINSLFIRTDDQGELVTYCDSFAFELSSNEIIYLSDEKIKVSVYCNWKQICDLLRRE